MTWAEYFDVARHVFEIGIVVFIVWSIRWADEQ